MATILLKRGLSTAVDSLELQVGEPAITTDTGDLYVGTTAGKKKVNGSGDVESVNGKKGQVVISKADVGLGNVENTADASKAVLSATKLATARTITLSGDVTGNVAFDGTKNVTIQANVTSIDGGTF